LGTKKQTQSNPIYVSPQHCWGLKTNLKKQACPEQRRMEPIFEGKNAKIMKKTGEKE